MKKTPSFITSLTDLIKEDDVRGVLDKIESKRGGPDFDLKCATKCLIELQLFVFQAINEGRSVASSTEDIFELGKKCLDTLEIFKWDISHSRYLTCAFYLIKYLLIKDELSLASSVCSSLQPWSQYNSQVNASEKKILSQICFTLNSYLYDIDLNKFLENNSADMNLLFDTCKLPCDLLINDEIILKNALLTFRSLIYKINSLNLELNDSVYMGSIKSVIKNYANTGNSIMSGSATFMAYLEVLNVCLVCIANKKNYQQLSHLLELIDVSKNLSIHKNSHSCLDVCKNLISLVLIDQGIADGNFSDLCADSSSSLEQLSSKNLDLMPWLLIFLFKTAKSFPFQFDNHSSAYHNFISLMLTACKIQKSVISSPSLKNVKTDSISKLIAFVNLVLLKTTNLPKECTNNEEFLFSIFECLEKVADYVVELLQFDHNCECSFKDHCNSLVGKMSFLIHLYYTANMFDNAFMLSLKLIEKQVRLSCNDSCHLSPKNKHYIYSVLLQCSIKASKVEMFVDVILAAVCKDPSSADKLLEQLATLKNVDDCSDLVKTSTFFQLLDKRTTLLANKWNISESVMNELKCTSIIMSELKAYCKLQPPQGGLLPKVLKQLLGLNPSLVDAAKGLVLVLDLSTKTHIDVEKFLKERLKIQENLRKQVKESSDFESLLLFGSLLHYSTLFKIYDIRKKIQIQTHRWKAQELPQTLNETGMFSDPHESCGPIAASELSFTNQQPLLDELETSFNYLKAALGKIESECNDFDTHVEIAFSNIKLTAQLYTLYHLKEKAIDAWILLYNLGERFSHQTIRISAVTNLLKLHAQFDLSWIDSAKELAVSLPDTSSEKQLFHICLASSCVKSSQISDAISHLTNVGAKFRNKKIRTYFLLILGQVLLIPESATLWKGFPSSAINAFDKAFRHLYHLINDDDWEGFIDHCMLAETFLDTLMCLKQFSSSIMMPRLSYYYLNEQSDVVQKLALPLRLAELLISLAWVDVSVHKKEDCDLKLANIIAILGLQKKKHVIGGRHSPLRKGLAFTDQSAAAVAEVSPSDDDKLRQLAAAPLSPPVLCRRGEWSQIVVHDVDCACAACRTPSFLQLTFDLLLLQAASCCVRRQFSQAIKYYDDALKYLECLGGGGGGRGKRIDEEWLRGRQVVLYYFYNEMLISNKNYGAAETGTRKITKHGVGPLPTEVYGVTVDHINLQRDNLIYHNLNKRLKKKLEKPKPMAKQRLAVTLQGPAGERTPGKTSAAPSHLLLSSANSTANTLVPVCDQRNQLIAAKALDFSSDEENEVVDATLVEKENNFVSPKLTKHRPRRNQLPAFVSEVPTLTKVANKRTESAKERTSSKVPIKKNDSSKLKMPLALAKLPNEKSKDNKPKPKRKFEICTDPPQSSSKSSTSSVVNSQKTEKPKRTVRAVSRK